MRDARAATALILRDTASRKMTPVAERPLGARIAALEAELDELRLQQREELVLAIAKIVGIEIAFSAAELFAHARVSAELRAAFDEIGIISPRRLGKRLHQIADYLYVETDRSHALVITRVGVDESGAIWTLRVVAHSQEAPCASSKARS